MDIKRIVKTNGGYSVECDQKQNYMHSKIQYADSYYRILNPMGICILSIGIFNTREDGVWITEMEQTIPKLRKAIAEQQVKTVVP